MRCRNPAEHMPTPRHDFTRSSYTQSGLFVYNLTLPRITLLCAQVFSPLLAEPRAVEGDVIPVFQGVVAKPGHETLRQKSRDFL